MRTKADYYLGKKRVELLNKLSDLGFSGYQQLKLTKELDGKSEKEKERIAARLIRQIESGEITKE